MSSLAPGNGWFPTRGYDGRKPGHAANVYAFAPVRPAVPPGATVAPDRSPLAGVVASVILQSARRGRSSAWLIGWCAFGLVLASFAWLGLVGALFAAAIIVGVPWTTAAAAFAAAHVLAATFATLVCVRVGRALIRSEKLQQLRATRP